MNSRPRVYTLWVLGADDPEMQEIEALLASRREPIAYATCDGKRVREDNAYSANGVIYLGPFYPHEQIRRPPWGCEHVYYVECNVAWPERADRPFEEHVIDHHRQGTPGYGRPPQEFLAASSYGQVVSELNRQLLLEPNAGISVGYGEDEYHIYGPNGSRHVFPGDASLEDYEDLGIPRCIEDINVSGFVQEDGTWWYVWHTGGCDVGEYDCAFHISEEIAAIVALDHCPDAARRGECPGVIEETEATLGSRSHVIRP